MSDDDEVNTNRDGSPHPAGIQRAATDHSIGDIMVHNGICTSAHSGTDTCQNITAVFTAQSNGAEMTQCAETTLVLAGVNELTCCILIIYLLSFLCKMLFRSITSYAIQITVKSRILITVSSFFAV